MPGRRFNDKAQSTAIRAHKGLRLRGLQEVTPRHQAAECDGRNDFPERRYRLADAILLQLLWPRTLQVNEITNSLAKRRIHFFGRTGIDHLHTIPVDMLEMQTILQHREWLLRMIGQKPGTLKLFPLERPRRRTAGDEESISLIDLSEMYGNIANALR